MGDLSPACGHPSPARRGEREASGSSFWQHAALTRRRDREASDSIFWHVFLFWHVFFLWQEERNLSGTPSPAAPLLAGEGVGGEVYCHCVSVKFEKIVSLCRPCVVSAIPPELKVASLALPTSVPLT